jgi:hypothetical protein
MMLHIPNLTPIYDRYRPSYEVKVQGTMYLWGSQGLETNLTFDKPLVLHVRNDVFGEAITFGTETTSDATKTTTTIGTLQPGEFVSIPLQGYSGVFATCALETVVACVIHST